MVKMITFGAGELASIGPITSLAFSRLSSICMITRLVGTIQKHYGAPEYTAFEVLFLDGRKELFWDHQLEEAKESPSLSKR